MHASCIFGHQQSSDSSLIWEHLEIISSSGTQDVKDITDTIDETASNETIPGKLSVSNWQLVVLHNYEEHARHNGLARHGGSCL